MLLKPLCPGKEVFLWAIHDGLELYPTSEACDWDKFFLQTIDFSHISTIFTPLHAILS